MIYGYDVKTLNEFGLKELREICFSTSPATLRELADFLTKSADELESVTNPNWHRHISSEIRQQLGCDVVVGTTPDSPTIA